MNPEPDPATNDAAAQRRAWTGATLRRLVCALALVPIVPATAFIAAACCEQWLGRTGFDNTRWTNLFTAVVTVAASVLIWRKLILWTLGRTALTALVAMIPFVQVVYAQPLWDAGCVANEILRTGQEQVSIGLYVWAAVWVWWGWERWPLRTSKQTAAERRPKMPPVAKRIVASMGTIPFAVGLFFIVIQVYEDLLSLPARVGWPASFATTAVAAVAAWILIWRTRVAWTAPVITWTIASAALLLGVPSAATFFLPDVGNVAATTLGFLPPIGWGAWMAATMWRWPMRAVIDPTTAAPRCTRCQYPLTGLCHTRCPECGHEPTLDELWSATAEAAL